MKDSIKAWKLAAAASTVALLFASEAAIGQNKSGTATDSAPASAQAASDASKTSSTSNAQSGKNTSADQSGNKGDMEKTSKNNANKSAKNNESALPPGHPAIGYLMVPITAPENKQWMDKGCWAKFHDGENFSGDTLTLVGPIDMPDMKGPFGIDWKGKISSVEVGKKARVLVYDNEGYKDLVSTFKPGQKAKDVSKKMGFFDEFSSLKLVCGKS